MVNYKKVLLKLSGEVLAGDPNKTSKSHQIFCQDVLNHLTQEIKSVRDHGIQIALVIGGGNIFRGQFGSSELGIARADSDYMGMLATVINAIAFHKFLMKEGIPSSHVTAIPLMSIGEAYHREVCLKKMEAGEVVIFSGGTGSPYFTTDTAAALRASEMGCDLLLKGTKVDGVYDKDPMKDSSATHFPALSYAQVLEKQLKVMDSTAFSLARENQIPINVFSIFSEGSLLKALSHKGKFTLINEQGSIG